MSSTSPASFVPDVRTRVWVISDLQTSDVADARRCLTAAVEDISALDLPLDRIWYLGDAIAGSDLQNNRTVTDVQVDLLAQLDAPLRYVLGNHDFDYAKKSGDVTLPFYEAVRSHPGWRTTERPDDFYFVEDLDEITVLFLSDHIATDAGWWVTHGEIHGDTDGYPYTASDYRAVIEELARRERPVVIAGHNSFPGGNRPAEIQRRFFPLPENVLVHLYGHAHIGDEVYVGKNLYRTISSIDDHPIPQVDVASLEDRRGDTIRSAVLEMFADGGCGISIRDHGDRRWLEQYRTVGYRS